jgi:hypothetical protein
MIRENQIHMTVETAPETANAKAALATALTAARVRMYAGQADVRRLENALRVLEDFESGPNGTAPILDLLDTETDETATEITETEIDAGIPRGLGTTRDWRPTKDGLRTALKVAAMAALTFGPNELFSYDELYERIVERGWDFQRAKTSFTKNCSELRTRIDEKSGKKVKATLARWGVFERVQFTATPKHRVLPDAKQILLDRGIIELV